MKAHHIVIVLFCAALIAILSSCTPQAAPPAPTNLPAVPTRAANPTNPPSVQDPVKYDPALPELKGDLIRGGKLYDAWWTELGKDPPKDNQPLFLTQTTNKASGASTWRCAECHGWDYKGVDGVFGSGSHKTGFPGILADRGKPPAQILAALQGKTNPAHDFSKVMKEQDLTDLALFVSQGTMDLDAVLNKDGTPKGTAADGREKFDQVCAGCHGPDGNAINFKTPASVEYLAHVSNSNSWQFVHRMRFGVAVWPMPAAIDNKFTDQDLVNVLAYARTLPKVAQAGGGGLLYDKWYTVLGVQTPLEDQPLWKNQSTNTRKGASTWSCRECHGIDYQGAAGEFASGSHKTGFPGIFQASTKTEQELTDILTGKVDPNHDFSKLVKEADIAALVHFIKKETFDMRPLIKADGKIAGDLEHGKVYYEKTCAQCHGKDGKAINFKTADAPEYVGTVAASEASVLLHRIYFGVPGFPMSAGLDLKMTLQELADVSAYAQTLPIK